MVCADASLPNVSSHQHEAKVWSKEKSHNPQGSLCASPALSQCDHSSFATKGPFSRELQLFLKLGMHVSKSLRNKSGASHTETSVQRQADPWNESQALGTVRNLSLLGYSCIALRGHIKWEHRSMHLCLYSLREHQGGMVKYSEIRKRQCKSSPYNLNSSNLGIYDWDAVFNYLIIIYTATEFALHMAEVPPSRISNLISYVANHSTTSKWFWAWQLIKTLYQPLHKSRHSSAQMNWYTLLAIFSRWILCELWEEGCKKYAEEAKWISKYQALTKSASAFAGIPRKGSHLVKC